MKSNLPGWLEHYLHLPAWALVTSVEEDRILWVNERLADDNQRDRAWFVGRIAGEVWPDSTLGREFDLEAVAEQCVVDRVEYGKDLGGVFRWLRVRRTPIDADRLLSVSEDVSAEIKLAGLRLLLGKGIAGESRTKLGEVFARQLLEGASLDSLCETQRMARGNVLAKLAMLVEEQAQPVVARPVLRPMDERVVPTDGLPKWVEHYQDLPVSVGLVEHPSLRVRWANRRVLEVNGVSLDEIVDRTVDDLWNDAEDLRRQCARAVGEGRSIDSIEVGRDLLGEQHWVVARHTPVGGGLILLMEEDVTAELRLQALRLLLGLSASEREDTVDIDDAFARLLLDGATVANICAALGLSQIDVLGKLGLLFGLAG